MKKLAIWIALLLAAICTLASCDKVLDDGPLTQEQIFDGKTVKDIYGQSVNKYNSHKGEKIPFSVELVMTSIDNENEKLELSLICDKENVSYNMSENSVSEEINFVDGKLYFKYTDGCKELYDSNRESVFEYIDGTTAVKGLEAAFPHDLPESWFNDLQFTADGDGYKVEINVDKNKANEHKKYPEFFKNGGICKIYFDESYVLDRVEFLGATVGGKLCNITVSYSWTIDGGVSEPDDKDNFSYKGTFDPKKKHEHDQYSQGLEFTSNGDGTCYVSGVGTCSDVNVIIPSISPEGDTVTKIGFSAFVSNSIISVVIPDSISVIDAVAFSTCSMTNVVIGSGVQIIGDRAFSGDKLVSIEVSDENTAFKSIDGNLYTKDGKTLITYAKAKLETQFIIPDHVVEIGDHAFYNCKHLTNITFSNNITTIGDSAFQSCTNISEISFPNSIVSIGSRAFEACSNIMDIHIPSNVSYIGGWAFARCYNLTNISVDVNNKMYKSIDGNLYTIDDKTLIQYSIGKTDESFIVMDSVTSISALAFSGCESISKIVFGVNSNLESIGYHAFSKCTNINNISIPVGVTVIWDWAFRDCDNLVNIVLPNTVKNIYYGAFEVCTSLKNVYYYGTSEEWSLISMQGGNSNLINATRYYYSETQPTTEGNFWHYVDGVPTVWDAYVEPENPGYSVGLKYTSNGDGTCYVSGIGTCTDTDIVIPPVSPEGWIVTSIGAHAFDSKQITSITLPEGIKYTSICSFYSCSLLSYIVIPKSLTDVGYSFHGCSSLSKVFYFGNEAEWNSINIYETGNESLINALRYYYSETAPTTEGNFWHYVDGVPTAWSVTVTP